MEVDGIGLEKQRKKCKNNDCFFDETDTNVKSYF